MTRKEAAEKVIQVARNYLFKEEFLPILSAKDDKEFAKLDIAVENLKKAVAKETNAEGLVFELKEFEGIRDELHDQLKPNPENRFFSDLEELEEKIENLDDLSNEQEKLDVLRSFNIFFSFRLPNQLKQAYIEIFEDHLENLTCLHDVLEEFSETFTVVDKEKNNLLDLIKIRKEAYTNNIKILEEYTFELSKEVIEALTDFDRVVDIHPEDFAARYCAAPQDEATNVSLAADLLEGLSLSEASNFSTSLHSTWHAGNRDERNVTVRPTNSKSYSMSPIF